MSIHLESWTGLELCGGRYQVDKLLGEGGMGFVYRARDRNLDTDVVIKVPRRGMLDDPEFAHRFAREIRSLVQLVHPHIVKISDAGEFDGLPFAVMQYLPGGSLEDRREIGPDGRALPMRPATLSRWLPFIAKALDFVHSRDIVHRDVKPGNILFDENGNAYLSDFGIAKALASKAGAARKATLTSAGNVVGTPEYMALELIMGQPFDGRADQYALAVTVYEVLAGRRPFQETGTAVMVRLGQAEGPPKLKAVCPAVSGGLSSAVQRGLAKIAAERYPTCAAFAAAVLAAVRTVPSTQKMAKEAPVHKSSPVASRTVVESPGLRASAMPPPALPETPFSSPAKSAGAAGPAWRRHAVWIWAAAGSLATTALLGILFVQSRDENKQARAAASVPRVAQAAIPQDVKPSRVVADVRKAPKRERAASVVTSGPVGPDHPEPDNEETLRPAVTPRALASRTVSPRPPASRRRPPPAPDDAPAAGESTSAAANVERPMPAPAPTATPAARRTGGAFLVQEDFRDLAPGSLPQGWSSPHKNLVKLAGAPGIGLTDPIRPDHVKLPELQLARDFTIEVGFSLYSDAQSVAIQTEGSSPTEKLNVTVFGDGTVQAQGKHTARSGACRAGATNRLVLERHDTSYHVELNGVVIDVMRRLNIGKVRFKIIKVGLGHAARPVQKGVQRGVLGPRRRTTVVDSPISPRILSFRVAAPDSAP
jgi:serine/threonine protein kinase